MCGEGGWGSIFCHHSHRRHLLLFSLQCPSVISLLFVYVLSWLLSLLLPLKYSPSPACTSLTIPHPHPPSLPPLLLLIADSRHTGREVESNNNKKARTQPLISPSSTAWTYSLPRAVSFFCPKWKYLWLLNVDDLIDDAAVPQLCAVLDTLSIASIYIFSLFIMNPSKTAVVEVRQSRDNCVPPNNPVL